jgi:mRNA-degrading endonuclease toxin of MazEF toxin-antitoxin module
MNRGDIYLGRFPLGGTVGSKVRPVLLLTDPVGPVPEVLAAYISSVVPAPLLPSDLLLDPSSPAHRGTNLKALSVVRLHKLSTLHQRDAYRHLGSLSAAALREVEQRLRLLLSL